ncbi:MAG: hypothetical protein ACOX0Y_02405 [Thiopseudomonas sp.]|jgi:hypothetical protein
MALILPCLPGALLAWQAATQAKTGRADRDLCSYDQYSILYAEKIEKHPYARPTL